MAARLSSWLLRPSLLRRLLSQLRLVVRLLREPRVPLLVKALPLFTAVYLVSPFDLAPDFFPVLGQVDDLVMVLITLEVFVRLCPPAATVFHRTAIAQRRTYSAMAPTDEVIDAEFRRE